MSFHGTLDPLPRYLDRRFCEIPPYDYIYV